LGDETRVDNLADLEVQLDECLVSYQQLVDKFTICIKAYKVPVWAPGML
jgi:hypothetical protein